MPSVDQVEDRLAKTMKRDLDAPVLRENCTQAAGVQTPQTVLTLEVVTPSVQQVEDRLGKTMKRDLDAPALRENWPYDFGKVFTEIRHVPLLRGIG